MKLGWLGIVAAGVPLVLFGGAAATPAPATASAASGLCTAGETPLFSCAIGAKTVSVCGGGAGAGRYAQYRYGTPAKVEMTSPKQGADALVYARTGYSGGGELQFSFANGAYRYVAYSRTVRTGFGAGGNKPKNEDGVLVKRGEKLLSDKRCMGSLKTAGEAEAFAREGEFVYPD